MSADYATAIAQGRTYLGIELGSTRIKAVLIDEEARPLASGGYDWENRLVEGIWTYDMDEVWRGLAACYAQLAADVRAQYGVALAKIGAMGVSAMMHGYLALDGAGELLTPFRTWRNTITGQASERLTREFGFPIPQRWSIAHLYQALLNGEEHVPRIASLTTLAGYVHQRLTGRSVLGVGEAAGVFPIQAGEARYDAAMMDKFDALVSGENLPWKLRDILPGVLNAGGEAGDLTREGALLLDPTGALEAGIALCPPEGDAGTGMVATNSVAARTGNVSAGTSVFAMVVLEKPLSRVYPEIDIVATPTGRPVAMVHCNNCTSDLNAWMGLFSGVLARMGASLDKNRLFRELFGAALEGEADCGGLLSYNFLSGEHIAGFQEGRPLFARTPSARLTVENFMRCLLFSALGTLKMGMNILTEEERVHVDVLTGHGGLFKTPIVGQRLMASALGLPIAIMETAGEGGAWGIALLAAYRAGKAQGETLEEYLARKVFVGAKAKTQEPDEGDAAGFSAYQEKFVAGFPIERSAVEHLRES